MGALIAGTGLDDAVDAAVAEGATRRNDAVVTSNRGHIRQVADSVGRRGPIHDV